MPPDRHLTCLYCYRRFPSDIAVRRHLGYATECRDRLDKILRQSKKVATFEGDDSAQSNVEVGGTLTDEPIDGNYDARPSQRPTLEEVEDADAAPPKSQRYVEPFPWPVATPTRASKEKTKFETLLEDQTKAKKDQWSPFASQEEWDLAVWLMKNVGQRSTDEFLKLQAVSTVGKTAARVFGVDVHLADA